jgi:hypothetical protein
MLPAAAGPAVSRCCCIVSLFLLLLLCCLPGALSSLPLRLLTNLRRQARQHTWPVLLLPWRRLICVA